MVRFIIEHPICVRVPLPCAMVYECGTEDLQVSDYVAIPPQIADFAGTESRAEWHNLFLA